MTILEEGGTGMCEYKVSNVEGRINKAEEWDALLNVMGMQGWRFIGEAMSVWKVFEREKK